MEKYAFEIVEDVMEKCARSYNAKRNKQYWQMMKKIHGGTDEAVDNITKNRAMDFLIAAPTGSSELKDEEFVFTNVGRQIHGEDNKRFKTPSELWGSKTLYPETTEFNNALKDGHFLAKSMTSRKGDIPEELLENSDFLSTHEKFYKGNSQGGSRSFKQLDEKSQRLGKKIAPPNLKRPQDDIPLPEEVSQVRTEKSKKPILAGLGLAGAGTGIGASVRKAIKSKETAKAQEKLKKKMALGAGVGVAGVAGTLGAGAAYKHNNRDIAAFEIVNDILSK